MGIFRSRARKQRDKAEAAYFRAQARVVNDQRQQDSRARREEAAGDNPWRQPTVGGALRAWGRRRQQG